MQGHRSVTNTQFHINSVIKWMRKYLTVKIIIKLLSWSTTDAAAILQAMWLESPMSEAQVHVCLPVCGAPWRVLLYHSITLPLFSIVECGIVHFLCAMHVFKVWASSSSLRLPLCLGMWRSSHLNSTMFKLWTFSADSKFVEFFHVPVIKFEPQVYTIGVTWIWYAMHECMLIDNI